MQENAYRLRVTDAEDDPLFVWLRMYDDETGLPSTRLLKASPEKDCDEKGGVTFAQWKETKGTFFPCQREFVRGLEETVFLRLTNQSCQWLDDTEPTLFDADRLNRPGNRRRERPLNPVRTGHESSFAIWCEGA